MTQKTRRVIFFAPYEACQDGSPEIHPEHLLLGLCARTTLGTAGCRRRIFQPSVKESVNIRPKTGRHRPPSIWHSAKAPSESSDMRRASRADGPPADRNQAPVSWLARRGTPLCCPTSQLKPQPMWPAFGSKSRWRRPQSSRCQEFMKPFGPPASAPSPELRPSFMASPAVPTGFRNGSSAAGFTTGTGPSRDTNAGIGIEKKTGRVCFGLRLAEDATDV